MKFINGSKTSGSHIAKVKPVDLPIELKKHKVFDFSCYSSFEKLCKLKNYLIFQIDSWCWMDYRDMEILVDRQDEWSFEEYVKPATGICKQLVI